LKLVLALFSPLFIIHSVNAATFSLSTPKRDYLRYELVPLEAKIEWSPGEPVTGVVPVVKAYRGERLVQNSMGEFHLRYDDSSRAYTGGWPIPFNPELGEYRLEVTVPLQSNRFVLQNSVEIEVSGKTLPSIDTAICAMTIEAQTDLIENPVSNPLGGRWDWRNYLRWAELLCANTILYSVGWSVEGKVTSEEPWLSAGPGTFGKLAEEAQKNGFKFGGWIGSFLVWGKPELGLGYRYCWEYEDGKLRRNHHVSLSDEKRIKDIAKLARKIDADPNVDYVGFDYIRPGPGGFEMVNDFVDSLAINTPENWDSMSIHGRMRWLGRILWEKSDRAVCARWDWWRAHKSASVLARIIEVGQVEKPVWVFVLGWDKGHQHGQDPIMLSDAGASFCAVMLYESTAEEEKAMIGQWSRYLVGDEVNLMVGEAVDWILMGESKEPEAPQEFMIRLSGGIVGLSRDYSACGLFWHDLNRTHWGSLGPYSRIEWVNAGAAAFTRLRSKRGELPFRTRVITHDRWADVVIENVTDQVIEDLSVRFIQTPGVALRDKRIKTVRKIGKRGKVRVTYKLKPDNRSMVAFQFDWRGIRGVDFEYYPNPYRDEPFRAFESVHAGGDVLVISRRTDEALYIGRNLRKASYSCNRISYSGVPKNVVHKYRYLILVDADLSSRPNLRAEIMDCIREGGAVVFAACTGFDLTPTRSGPASSKIGSLAKGSFAVADHNALAAILKIMEQLN